MGSTTLAGEYHHPHVNSRIANRCTCIRHQIVISREVRQNEAVREKVA